MEIQVTKARYLTSPQAWPSGFCRTSHPPKRVVLLWSCRGLVILTCRVLQRRKWHRSKSAGKQAPERHQPSMAWNFWWPQLPVAREYLRPLVVFDRKSMVEFFMDGNQTTMAEWLILVHVCCNGSSSTSKTTYGTSLRGKAQPSLNAPQNDHGRWFPVDPKQQEEVDGSCSQRSVLSGIQILLSLQHEVAFIRAFSWKTLSCAMITNKVQSNLSDFNDDARFWHLERAPKCHGQRWCRGHGKRPR